MILPFFAWFYALFFLLHVCYRRHSSHYYRLKLTIPLDDYPHPISLHGLQPRCPSRRCQLAYHIL